MLTVVGASVSNMAAVYSLLLEASKMPASFRYLQVRLSMERDKLVDWAVLANLSEDETTLNPGLKFNKHTINDALHEIKLVLVDLSKLTERHDLEAQGANNAAIEGKDYPVGTKVGPKFHPRDPKLTWP